VFFTALLGFIFNLEITVPFYSEYCVLHLHRREKRRGLELQSLAHGEVVLLASKLVSETSNTSKVACEAAEAV